MYFNIMFKNKQMYSEDKLFFKQFYYESFLHVPLAKNILEKIIFGLFIFIGLLIFLIYSTYIYTDGDGYSDIRWAFKVHIVLFLYSALISCIRILTIARSIRFFINNFLNHFFFFGLIMISSILCTFPSIAIFNINVDEKSEITIFFDKKIYAMQISGYCIIIFGLLSTILFPVFINDILSKNLIIYVLYSAFTYASFLFILICLFINKKILFSNIFK